jgi:hypothetical protein
MTHNIRSTCCANDIEVMQRDEDERMKSASLCPSCSRCAQSTHAPSGNLRKTLLLNLRQRLLPDFVSHALDVRSLLFDGNADCASCRVRAAGGPSAVGQEMNFLMPSTVSHESPSHPTPPPTQPYAECLGDDQQQGDSTPNTANVSTAKMHGAAVTRGSMGDVV